MKIGFNRHSGFRGEMFENVDTHTYGRQKPAYTISSPMSLKARVS